MGKIMILRRPSMVREIAVRIKRNRYIGNRINRLQVSRCEERGRERSQRYILKPVRKKAERQLRTYIPESHPLGSEPGLATD